MEYQVPQFVEIEDKIVGPLTLKQFIYIAGGAGLCIVFILYLPLFLGVLLSIPVAALAGALAFYKVNNKTFVEMLEAGFKYYIGSRLYLWKKEKKSVTATAPQSPTEEPARQKLVLSRGKLEELAWSLDIKDKQTPEA
ncbi:MAG TPA: PrgI family protein [Candidatus Paceibacterota bacterium]|nr:PrgI family protein [Candidatus Paceibacterota bacterium]